MSSQTDNTTVAEPGAPVASRVARKVRRDLRFLRLYVFTVPTVMKYPKDPECEGAAARPGDILSRVESGLSGEADRYRIAGWSILAIVLMPALVAAFLWYAMYWLPVTIYWWPFDRGLYGLPFFSLYEWVCFLLLAAYFAVTWAVLRTSRTETRRLAVDYCRLAAADDSLRSGIATEVGSGSYPRASFVLRTAKPFSAYAPLIAESGHGRR